MKKGGVLTIIIVILIVIGIISFLIYKQFFISENPLVMMELRITSTFSENGKIPPKYTCDGENINPPLKISDIPEAAKTLAIVVDDPDAPMGIWVHWIVWNIPVEGTTKNIGEAEKPGVEGINGFKNKGYGGPCPPGGTHHYSFRVYALDVHLDLKEGSTKQELEAAMKGHILAKGELIGLYSKEE